ncbi:MAG: efflux RND transporter periplasmic adaptor subunit [Pirellulales bacterium]|nr:efflux RND transporter periplasmic adaptor subunit [Pirellulales bacterium]
MPIRNIFTNFHIWLWLLGMGLLLTGAFTWNTWSPPVRAKLAEWIRPTNLTDSPPTGENPDSKPADDHAGHDHSGHDHSGHDAGNSLEISANGLKNIGFRPHTIKLEDFERKLTLPALIVERPGHSQVQIPAPLTGVVTKVHIIEGSAVEPGSPLFDVRLTHEEVVVAQREFLRSAENLDVINREIKRLESAGDGALAGKRLLEQQYDKQKLEASMKAERQALLLHGINEAQIEDVLKTRQLLQSITIYAPAHQHTSEDCPEDHLFHIQKLSVKQGQHLTAGQELCVLADHCELYVEGKAFETDAEAMRRAIGVGSNITASLKSSGKENSLIPNLKLLYMANHVDPETRSFQFYLSLPNAIESTRKTKSGQQFIQWKYRPGQRLELLIPVEKWTDRIVLPVEAVVEEGAENYVFQQNGDHFDRIAVHVEYRDIANVVIENDGTLFPGDLVAAKGAYQMQLALKNKAGGGIDPHAGHNH